MTDQPINRENCPWCGSDGNRTRSITPPPFPATDTGESDAHLYECGVWWKDWNKAPDGPRTQACFMRERDTLQSKLAQAVEALEAVQTLLDVTDADWATAIVRDQVRSTLSTLKDNPQPINKDNP